LSQSDDDFLPIRLSRRGIVTVGWWFFTNSLVSPNRNMLFKVMLRRFI